MKAFLTLTVIALLTAGVRAQQLDNPVTVPVSYYGWGQAGTGSGSFYFGGELGAQTGASGGSGAAFYSTPVTVQLVPGKEYLVQMHNDGLSVAYPYFQSRPGFDIYLNGIKTTTTGGDGYNYFFRVRVEAINDLSGALAGTRGGECSAFPEDKPIWYLGLGAMRNGRFAGAMGFRAGTLVDSGGAEVTRLFTSSSLVYDSVDTSEVSVSRDANGYITQIQSREVVVLVDPYNASGTSYDIKVCAIATPTTPFITYTIKRRPVTGGYGIQIDRTENGVTWSTALEQVVSTTTLWTRYGWRVNTGGSFDIANKTVTTWSGATATSDYGGGLQTQTKTYASFPWGIELTGLTAGGAPSSSYAYYSDSTGSGWAQALKSMTGPHGNWTKYDYYNTATDSRAGLVQRIYRPWLDDPVDANSATVSNSHVETYDYAANFDGQMTAPSSRVVTISGTQVAKTTWDYNFNHSSPNSHTVSQKTQKDYSTTSDFITTTSLSYLPTDADTYFRGRSHSITHADGRKDSFAYYQGTWDTATRAFTASAGGADRLVLAFHGQTSGGTPVSSWTMGSVAWTIDALHLVAGRSTATETIVDAKGRTVFAAENVYTSSGTLERLSGTLYSFDTQGRLFEELDVVRTVGVNRVKTTRAYTASLLDSITGPDGVVTRFEYDSLLRMWRKTEGEGGSAAYPARIQRLSFDAANRVTGVSPFSGGTPITLTIGYDTAGRMISRVEPSPGGGNLTTSYDHSTVRRLTTTLPTGATLIDNIHRDGRPKSFGGSARGPSEYDYAVNSTGIKVTRRNGATTANGWSETQHDHLGRAAKQSGPTWGWISGNNNILDVDFTYNSATGLLTKQATTYRASPGNPLVPDRRFVYEAGRLTQEGFDMNADGALTTNSNDRLTSYDTSFTKDTWGWRAYDTTSIYATSGSSAATPVAQVYTRLTGFNGGALAAQGIIVGDTVSIDANGRATTAWDFIDPDPAQKRRRSEVQVQGASVLGYAESRNGYSYESQAAASGARTRQAYDSLGRPQYVYHRWNGTAFTATDSYAYHGNTPYVDSQTVGGIATSFAYAWGSSARTVTATTGGVSSYTLYNEMDLPKRVGGAGASPQEYGYDLLGRRTTLKTWRDGPYTEATWPTSGGDTTTWNLEAATGLLSDKTYADHTTGAPRKTTYTYTALGQPATRTWARGVTSTYGYFDGSTTTTAHVSHRTHELRAITYSDGTAGTSYTYTRAGQAASVSDATGTRDFIYSTDQPLRLDAEGLSSFYNSRVLTQLYDSVYRGSGFKLGVTGNLAADLTQTHAYGATGLFDHIDTQRAAQAARTFTYGYHANTGLVSGYSNGSFSVGYDYEPANAMRTRVESQWSGTSLARFDLKRDSRGLIQSAKQSGTAFADHYSGTSYNSVFNYYAYNSRGELQTVTMSRGAPPTSGAPPSADELPGRRFEYRFDSMGNRLTAGSTGTVAGGDEEYTLKTGGVNQYDTKENNTVRVLGTAVTASAIAATSTGTTGSPVVVTEKDRSFAADAGPDNSAGPKRGTLTVTATLPGSGGSPDLVRTLTRDWVIPRQTQTLGYDADGNLTSDGMWNYAYDGENRLRQMTSALPPGQGHVRRQLEFKYDYLGRRVEKTVLNLDTSVSATQRFLYDGWNLVAELNGTGTTLERSYTWGLDVTGSLGASAGVGALVQLTDHNSGKSYLPGYDGNGNVSALFDAADGTVAALYEYSPFGELLRAEGAYAAANPFRFSTRFLDTETGMVYYGFRYYSPRMGRFINRDPIGEAGGANLYGFAGNNGVNGWDVLGLQEGPTKGDPFEPIYSSSPAFSSNVIQHLLDNWFGSFFNTPVPWTNGSAQRPAAPNTAGKSQQPSADVGPRAAVTSDGRLENKPIAPNRTDIPELRATTDFDRVVGNYPVQFTIGVAHGATDLVKGVVYIVVHPIDTASNLAEQIAKYGPGFIIKGFIDEADRARQLGEGYSDGKGLFIVGTILVPAARARAVATAEGGAARVASGAESVNAAAALRSKLSALENAQKTAVTTRTLPDGRIRYYGGETPASKPGPTRGAAYVTEWNPNTGQVRAWMESYNQAGEVTRVHPKMINGQSVNSPHYPPTGRELGLP